MSMSVGFMKTQKSISKNYLYNLFYQIFLVKLLWTDFLDLIVGTRLPQLDPLRSDYFDQIISARLSALFPARFIQFSWKMPPISPFKGDFKSYRRMEESQCSCKQNGCIHLILGPMFSGKT